MANTDASEAARQLVRQRWGTRGLDRAVDVVVTRSAELSQEQLAELAAVLEHGTEDGNG